MDVGRQPERDLVLVERRLKQCLQRDQGRLRLLVLKRDQVSLEGRHVAGVDDRLELLQVPRELLDVVLLVADPLQLVEQVEIAGCRGARHDVDVELAAVLGKVADHIQSLSLGE